MPIIIILCCKNCAHFKNLFFKVSQLSMKTVKIGPLNDFLLHIHTVYTVPAHHSWLCSAAKPPAVSQCLWMPIAPNHSNIPSQCCHPSYYGDWWIVVDSPGRLRPAASRWKAWVWDVRWDWPLEDNCNKCIHTYVHVATIHGGLISSMQHLKGIGVTTRAYTCKLLHV